MSVDIPRLSEMEMLSDIQTSGGNGIILVIRARQGQAKAKGYI